MLFQVDKGLMVLLSPSCADSNYMGCSNFIWLLIKTSVELKIKSKPCCRVYNCIPFFKWGNLVIEDARQCTYIIMQKFENKQSYKQACNCSRLVRSTITILQLSQS